MGKPTRFLAVALAAALMICLPFPSTAYSVNTPKADIIFTNGTIYTLADTDEPVEALAVKDDTIVAVGSNDDVLEYAGTSTTVYDLEGKMITPGFVDSHIHAALEQINALYFLDLKEVEPTQEAYLAALKAYDEKNPEVPVIYGVNFQLNAFPASFDGAAKALDGVVSDKPVVISDSSYHMHWVNSKAMAEASLTKDSKPSEGGEIYREADGSLSGVFADCQPFFTPITARYQIGEAEFLKAFELFEEESAAKGITAINSMQLLGTDLEGEPLWRALDNHAKSGNMKLRANVAHTIGPKDDVTKEIQVTLDGKKYNSDFLHVGTIKMFLDGVVEGKTGLLMEPYAPEAGMPADYKGVPIWPLDDFRKAVAAIDKAGIQLHIHAIGDGAVHEATNAIEKASDANGTENARHAFTHITLMQKSDIKRMADLGIAAAMQPIWFYKDPIFSQLERQMLGEERFTDMYCIRDMVEAGIMLTGSADSPVTPDNHPLSGIQTGVTQASPYGDQDTTRNADQTVDVMTMLKAYTINGAKLMAMDDKIGTLETGKKADLVILNEDFTKVDPSLIVDTVVEATMMNGAFVYEAEDFSLTEIEAPKKVGEPSIPVIVGIIAVVAAAGVFTAVRMRPDKKQASHTE